MDLHPKCRGIYHLHKSVKFKKKQRRWGKLRAYINITADADSVLISTCLNVKEIFKGGITKF